MSLFENLGEEIQHLRPPLTFQGNKKNLLKPFLKVLHSYNITPGTIFVDVFGGSGLISHHLKQNYPQNRVIWNDFDDFAHRLEIAPITEKIRAHLCEIVARDGFESKDSSGHERLKKETISEIKSYLAGFDEDELDCIQLSNYLCFSGQYKDSKAELLRDDIKVIQYNHLPQSPINTRGYLQNGVERVQKDYRELIAKFGENPHAFFVLDPPYLQTSEKTYTQHFRLADFLDLVKFFVTHPQPSVYFSSKRSDCAEFFEWYMAEKGIKNTIKTWKAALTISKGKDTDIMFYK